MPRVHITGRQDDLRVGIGLDELLSEGTSRPVTDSLAVAQQLIPLLATKLAHALVLGQQGIVPHQTVWGVLNTRAHHVVALQVAQSLQRNPQRSRSRASNSQRQDLHWHRTATLSSVNACVAREDIRDGLRGQVVRVRERHDGQDRFFWWLIKRYFFFFQTQYKRQLVYCTRV